MKIVSAFAAVVIFALGTTAVSSQQDPIAARKAIMKSNGQAAGALAKMIKGEAPFDLPTAKKAFATFEDAAAKMPGLSNEMKKNYKRIVHARSDMQVVSTASRRRR